MLGGTFSPPHIGHLEMARAVLDKLCLDEIIFIPCGDPPHKAGNSVWNAKLRYELTCILIENQEKMTVSDIEIKNCGKSYTALTLKQLKKDNPETTYYFIVGADSLCYMDEWKTPEIIFENAEIVVIDRVGYSNKKVNDYIAFLENKYNAVIHKVYMENIDISSSLLRDKLFKGEDISVYTGQEIYDCILENLNEN